MWKYWEKTRKKQVLSYLVKLDSSDVWTTENTKERWIFHQLSKKGEKYNRNALPSCKEHGISLSTVYTVNCSRR